jgi:RND family efflux transporter MFP subunit
MTNGDLAGLKINESARINRSAMRHKRLLWGALLVVGVVAGTLLYRLLFAPVVQVELGTVSQVYPSQTFTLLNASGYVVAQRKAAVAAKTTGRLEWLGVEEGSRVRQGQILARLESRDAAAARDQAAANLSSAKSALKQAEADLYDATRSFSRHKELLGQGIVAQAEYDTAEARYRRLEAAVAAAESNIRSFEAALRGAEVTLDYALIRAPFDAVVLTKNADVGDIVTPLGAAANAKSAVVTIADLRSLLVEADVSESNLEKVKVGQPCEIHLDALPDMRFRGVAHMIVPTADRSKATVLVKARFLDQDNRILPEMSAKVAFLERAVTDAEKRPKTAVNLAAVVSRDGRNLLFLVKGDRAVEAPVILGDRIGDMVEIVSGAHAGDKLAMKPLNRLRNGTRVKSAEK